MTKQRGGSNQPHLKADVLSDWIDGGILAINCTHRLGQ
jgi:hypothetical protein